MSSDTFLVFRRGIRRGLLTLWREQSFSTTIAALIGILLVAQLLVVVLLTAQGMESLIRTQTDLRLEILDDASDGRIQEFYEAARSLPGVEGVQYITREQAYENERKRDPELINRIEQFKLGNPFPDTLAVTLHSLNDYESFAAFVRQPEWRDVVNPEFLSQATNQEQRINDLLRITRAGRLASALFLCLIAVVLLFVLMEVVRRRALMRSEEVFIERLFGASNSSVLLPFATESVTLLFLALVVSVALLVVFLFSLPLLLPALAAGGVLSALSGATEPLLRTLLPIILLGEVLIAPVLAFLGALFGLWPQLRSRKLVEI